MFRLGFAGNSELGRIEQKKENKYHIADLEGQHDSICELEVWGDARMICSCFISKGAVHSELT